MDTPSQPVPQDPAAVRLRKLITDYFLPRALYGVSALDVAGCIGDAALAAEEIAGRLQLHAPSLYRTMRALATVGVFEEDAQGRFSNTPMSHLLRADAPDSLRDLALLFGDQTSWRAWEAIVHSLRTGESGFEHVYQEKFFDYLTHHADTAAMFDRAMASSSSLVNTAVVAAFDFSGFDSLCDVAGGVGSTLCAILNANPQLRGILFDLPHAEPRARAFIDGQGLSGRCQFTAGSFFDSVPEGAALYFMKHILHDWGEGDCRRILQNCARAMGERGRLLVCERIVPEGNAYSPAKLIDLHMLMTNHGGKERTEQEYRELLSAAGLRLERVIPTGSPYSLLEALPG